MLRKTALTCALICFLWLLVRVTIFLSLLLWCTSLVVQTVKNLPAVQKTCIWSLGWKDPLKKGVATHSSTLAWRITHTKEPDALQAIGSQRIGHDWVTNTTYILWLLVRVTILLFLRDSSFVNFLFTIFSSLLTSLFCKGKNNSIVCSISMSFCFIFVFYQS